jgi:hypothetical protein
VWVSESGGWLGNESRGRRAEERDGKEGTIEEGTVEEVRGG